MNTTLEDIRIATQPTFKAYLSFVMWAAFRQARWGVVVGVVSLGLFLLIPFAPTEQQIGLLDRYRNALGLLIIPGLAFVFLPVATYFGARKRWQSAADLREPRTYTFSDAGIDIAAESFNSQISWKHVVTADKHRGQILLGTAQKQFYLVPVEAFESQEHLDRFVELIKSKVPNCHVSR